MSSLCLIVPLQSSPMLSLANFGAIIIYRVSSKFREVFGSACADGV